MLSKQEAKKYIESPEFSQNVYYFFTMAKNDSEQDSEDSAFISGYYYGILMVWRYLFNADEYAIMIVRPSDNSQLDYAIIFDTEREAREYGENFEDSQQWRIITAKDEEFEIEPMQVTDMTRIPAGAIVATKYTTGPDAKKLTARIEYNHEIEALRQEWNIGDYEFAMLKFVARKEIPEADLRNPGSRVVFKPETE